MPEYLLGIGNLPDVTGKMLAGRLYVVMHDADLGLEVVCRTVVAASASGRVDWLAEVPSAYLGVVPQLGREVADCLREQTLRIFQSTSENPHGMCRRILKDLDLIGVAGGGLVIADGADRFIEEVSDEAWEGDLSAWQKWAERTGCAVLWMCPRRAGQFGHEADLLRMAHRFSGMARLRKSGDELRWDVYYWFGNEGLMLDKSFRLNADDSGSCWVEEHHSVPAGEAELIVDEDEVYIMKAALPAGRSTPSGWRVFDTVEQMSVALSSARAPTVIFHHNPGGSFETLARAVFELRRAIGAYVKIVIKETGGRLRHSHEQLLLSLGANLTIPGETGFAHMLSLLRSIQGQVYSRILPTSFHDAMTSIMTTSQTGYLAPKDFMRSVSEIMLRSQSLEVDNALVRLFLTPGLDILETLRCCTIKRPGDLYSADDKSVYVFLFACEEQDISATLDRLFRLPVSVLFSGESRALFVENITSELEAFGQRNMDADYPDHSTVLVSNPFAGERTRAVVVPDAPVRRSFTAIPHPLKLRAAQV